MISKVKRYFLEIKDFSNPIELNIPKNQPLQGILSRQSDPDFYRFATELIKEQNKYNISEIPIKLTLSIELKVKL